jgi:hypothetical protein
MKLRVASPMLSAGCIVDEVVYYVAYRVFRYTWLTGSMHGEERKILSSRNVRIDVNLILGRSGLSVMEEIFYDVPPGHQTENKLQQGTPGYQQVTLSLKRRKAGVAQPSGIETPPTKLCGVTTSLFLPTLILIGVFW